MAPSVDKQTPTKMVNMLPSEEKPMEICANVSENAAVFPPRVYVHEYYEKAALGFRTSDARLSSESPPLSPQELYDRPHHHYTCSCTLVTPQSVNAEAESRIAGNHQRDTWYAELMGAVWRGDIAINGGVDAIRQTPLQLTVRRGDYETMRLLLRHGASVHAKDETGMTALLVAAELGDAAAAEILLERGASVRDSTERGFDVAAVAVQSGSARLVRLLLARGCCGVDDLVEDRNVRRRFSLLHWAIDCNSVVIVHLLLQYHADANQRDTFGNSCLHEACRLGNREIVDLLLRYGARVHERSSNNSTALSIAVERGHRDVFELLLRHGANLNDQGPGGATPLHYAIKNGDVELIRALLRCGARVDATNRFGQTPLHCAIAEKNWRALQLLFEHGADANGRDSLGKTPLHAAIEAGRREIYEALLERRADVNARDGVRQTPLHYAVRQGCLTTVERLLRRGADVNARDDARQTPLHLAVRFGHVALFGPMLKHEVDVDARDANGQTPLHLAVLGEQAKLICYGYSFTFFHELLKSGARVRARTASTGETALHLAVKKRCPIFAKHLLSRGSDVDALDALEEKTPLRVAVENEDAECVEQLLTHGADVAKLMATTPRFGEDVALTFARHFVRRRVAGMAVDPRYLEVFGGDEEFARQCEDEVKIMKLTKIGDEQTYYDFLRGSRRCLVKLVGSSQVSAAFEEDARTKFPGDESAIRRSFPAYADTLARNYHVGVRYVPVLAAASERLGELLGLPDVPVERILDFLDDDDMRNVVRAVPSLANCS